MIQSVHMSLGSWSTALALLLGDWGSSLPAGAKRSALQPDRILSYDVHSSVGLNINTSNDFVRVNVIVNTTHFEI